MEPTTGASPHQQAGEQHIRLRHQSNQAHPPVLEHQRQSPTVSDHSPWVPEAALEAHLHQRQALVAIQDLEHQRLQMWSQDSGENQHR